MLSSSRYIFIWKLMWPSIPLLVIIHFDSLVSLVSARFAPVKSPCSHRINKHLVRWYLRFCKSELAFLPACVPPSIFYLDELQPHICPSQKLGSHYSFLFLVFHVQELNPVGSAPLMSFKVIFSISTATLSLSSSFPWLAERHLSRLSTSCLFLSPPLPALPPELCFKNANQHFLT